MINKLADKTANYLVDNVQDLKSMSVLFAKHTNKDYQDLTKKQTAELISYSLKGIYSDLAKTIFLLILGGIFHVLLPVFLIMLTFSSFRLFAGGSHMDDFTTCLIATILTFFILALIVNQTYLYVNDNLSFILIIITSIISFYMICRYAPRNTPNKPINDVEKIKKYKSKSISYILTISVIMMFLYQYHLIVLSLVFGILLEVFTITPIGVRIFSIFERLLNKIFKINIQ